LGGGDRRGGEAKSRGKEGLETKAVNGEKRVRVPLIAIAEDKGGRFITFVRLKKEITIAITLRNQETPPMERKCKHL